MSAAAMFCGLAVDVFRIGDVCCLPAPEHQPFFFNSLDLSAPEEAYSRNVCASGTLKLGMKVFLSFKQSAHARADPKVCGHRP